MSARKLSFSSAVLTASSVHRAYGPQVVLSNISLVIGPESRIGIVGPNGVGKSTLLQILARIESPDLGSISIDPPTASVGYLAQEYEPSDETVREVLARRTGVAAAEVSLQLAAETLSRGGSSSDYSKALERWESLGASNFDARVETVLVELGLNPNIVHRTTSTLSGGQQARVALSGILLSRYDILLLDEPTNDLDFDGLDRLERFVHDRVGGFAIVSHDRDFLDRTISSVYEIDEHDRSGHLYRGGWSAYLEERATGRRHAEERYASYEVQRKGLVDRARRERDWATSGVRAERRRPKDNDKAQRDFRLNRTEQLASRARRTERALERLAVVDKPWEGWDLRLTIGEAPRAGAVVVRLTKAVADRGSFRLGPLDLEINWGDRIALTGPNGSGKSTLLKVLFEGFPLASGERWVGPSVAVGELGQRRVAFAQSATLLEAFTKEVGLDIAPCRALLAKFGLGSEHVTRAVASLSPGERTRAELALFQARGVNVLVLDEPTNHLDLPAIEQLEEALDSYRGTLVLVSHDRRLLENLDFNRRIELPVDHGVRAP